MPRFELDIDPVQHITTDAIGQPGQRVFYIQAIQDARILTIIIEKIQLQALIINVEKFIAEISRQHPNLPEADTAYNPVIMRITPPVEPLFRAGELGLGYDTDRDMAVLIARELLMQEEDPEEAAVVRFWCTRSQLRSMSRWGLDVVQSGRPICVQCGQPIDPGGHFCPKKNGHRP
jgi:uncharacterized repeat protein (TIGR03847 family)